jgi:CRP/FNR family transcriptional activator FtrB
MKPSDREAFSGTPIFRNVPPEILDRLAIGAFVQTLPKGARLFEQGETAEFLHMLLEGRCGLVGARPDGEECVVEIMHAGEVFILPAILLDAPYLMSALVLETSRIAMIPAAPLRRALEQEPLLMRAVALDLARYWRVFVQQIKDLKLRSTHERVAGHLSTMCKNTRHGAAVLNMDEECRSIAAKLGMTPESWSRSIRQLKNVGVRSAGRRIEIDDVVQLRTYAKLDGLQ